MSQSLLAVGALVLLTLLSFNMKRGTIQDDQRSIETQTVAAANRVAVDELNRLRALPFDTTTAARPAQSPLALHPHPELAHAPADRFGSLEARRQAAAARAGTIAGADGAVQTVSRSMPEGTARFEVATVVGYVADDGVTPSATPTPLKVATVRVRPLDWDAPDLYISQLYACGASCLW